MVILRPTMVIIEREDKPHSGPALEDAMQIRCSWMVRSYSFLSPESFET